MGNLQDTAPPIDVIDERVYQDWKNNNRDGYGKAIFIFVENWACLMQIEIAKGKTVEDVAEATSYQASTELSGFMYGAAVAVLSRCWKHGEELSKWHDRQRNL